MVSGKRLFFSFFGLASCGTFIYLSFGELFLGHELVLMSHHHEEPNFGFVERNGSQFMLDGRAFYINGWNSFWLMDQAVDEYRRPRVKEILQAGAKMGLTVCRIWAFNDGAFNALQLSPGHFNERVFQALDYVIAEARQHGIRLLLSLVNNWHDFGGKAQYVKWAMEEGRVGLSASNDSFFFDPSIRRNFKNYIKSILTRRNSISGIEYRNDPTIFSWELINEPQCISDASGDTLHEWIEHMSCFVKSIDKKHLVSVGLEGFYGPRNPKSMTINPGKWASELGSDFIRNSNISSIDFASVHIYPDLWLKDEKEVEEKLKYVSKWMLSHIEDGDKELRKPVMFAEFGSSNLSENFHPSQRDRMYKTVLDIIYESAKESRSGAGGLFWQFLAGGMEEVGDEFSIVPWSRPSTYRLIKEQSCKLATTSLARFP